MYHVIGERFTDLDSVKRKIQFLGAHWNDKVSTSIVKYSLELGGNPPKSDEPNGITRY